MWHTCTLLLFIYDQIEAALRQKLKNPQIFISPTRVCIHNLPVSVDDRRLRQVILKTLDDRSVNMTEVGAGTKHWQHCLLLRNQNQLDLTKLI